MLSNGGEGEALLGWKAEWPSWLTHGRQFYPQGGESAIDCN